MARIDIKLDSDRQLQSSGGDLLVADATIEHTEYIVVSDVGHWKEFPTVGVGIYKYLGGPANISRIIEGKIIEQLKADGYKPPKVDASDLNNIKINNLIISTEDNG